MAIFPVTRLHDIAVTDHHTARRGLTEPMLVVVLTDVDHKATPLIVIKAIMSSVVAVPASVPAVVPVLVFAVMLPFFVLVAAVAMIVILILLMTIEGRVRPRPAGQRAWAKPHADTHQHHHQKSLESLHKLSLLGPPWKAPCSKKGQ